MSFSPKRGWTNDPNGLIVIDGNYHLFFQYYPDDIVWGPMHWGHAISKDGINWEELPVAIYPEENGYIFSGSTILDKNDVSGLFDGSELTDNKVTLLCFYTEHNPVTGEQQQCIAYSNDYINFEKYKGNPVIKNTMNLPDYKKDFRDPKVFENTVIGGFSMVVAAGSGLEFYHSKNLLDWEYTGRFAVSDYLGAGICECPDCIQIDNKWILTLSYIPMSVPEDAVSKFTDRHTMNYFAGSFDGYTFVADEGEQGNKLLDFGPDNYAMVSFANADKKLMMGWAENWDYVYDIPAEGSRGSMTSIRDISLECTYKGVMISQQFIEESEKATIPVGKTVEIELPEGKKIEIFADDRVIRVRRDRIKGTDESRWLSKDGYNCFETDRINPGECQISYKRHRDLCEILADGGCISFTVRV